ncbi:prepilin-type N-terminal cleavage/methylation domain-containing protein [Candidatus Microgenomates bacterium]|nr:prepilin-type N-terminal cleavage/methylation domain-containing protein [Candidatus Microgenomates bacterium]
MEPGLLLTELMGLKLHKKGMSLIESMLALMVLAVVVTTVTTLIVQIDALSNSTRMRTTAVLLAQDSLEQVRGYYQTNGWNALLNKSGNGSVTGCYTDGTLATIPATCATQTDILTSPGYKRIVKLVLNGNQISAQIYIYWNDHNVSKSVESDSSFYSY